MNYYDSGFPYSEELYHHGTKGQKWGERRYQNEDGSLTPLGRIHYGVGKARDAVVKAYKRKHPRFMTDDELSAEINRQRKLNELKEIRIKGRKGSSGDRAKELMWKGAETAVKEIAKSSMTKLGEGFASRILETNQQKSLREMTEKTDFQKARGKFFESIKEANEKYTAYQDAENAKKRAEEAAKNAEREANQSRKRQAAQAAEYERQRKEQYKANAQRARSEVDGMLEIQRKRQEEAQRRREEVEKLKRKVKYGPGGSAYR